MTDTIARLVLLSPGLLFLLLLAFLTVATPVCCLGTFIFTLAKHGPNPYLYVLTRTLDESGLAAPDGAPVWLLLLLILALIPTVLFAMALTTFWDTVSLPLQLILAVRWGHAEKNRKRNEAVAKQLRKATAPPKCTAAKCTHQQPKYHFYCEKHLPIPTR